MNGHEREQQQSSEVPQETARQRTADVNVTQPIALERNVGPKFHEKISTAIPSCVPCTEGGYLKDCAVLGSAPCAVGATALSSRGEPHRYKEMRHNHLG